MLKYIAIVVIGLTSESLGARNEPNPVQEVKSLIQQVRRQLGAVKESQKLLEEKNKEVLEHDCETGEAKKKKLLVWSLMKWNTPQVHMSFIHSNRGNVAAVLQYTTSDPEWLVFSTSAFALRWKYLNNEWASYLIAVNKKEALESKVVALATSFKKKE